MDVIMEAVQVNEYITSDPEICGGKMTFKGTRIMVWQIFEMLEAGESIDGILRNYPSLTREHVKAAMPLIAERLAGERFAPFH